MKKAYLIVLQFLLMPICIFGLFPLNANAMEDNSSSYPLIEEIAAMYDKWGDFESWPEEGYIQASHLLVTANIIEEDLFQGNTALSAEDMQKMLLDKLPGDYSGFINRFIENIWGNSNYWSLQDKAWYTQMLIRHDLLTPYDRLYQMPDKYSLSYDEVRTIALDYVMNEYHISQTVLQQLTAYYSYYATQQEPDNPVWKVLFCEPVSSSPMINITIDRNGSLIECYINNYIKDENALKLLTPESGRIYELTLEEQAQYAQLFMIPMFGLPGENDLPESIAREKADQFLMMEESLVQDQLDSFVQYASFVIYGEKASVYPIWRITYVEATSNRPLYSVDISSVTGELVSIETVDWDSPGLG